MIFWPTKLETPSEGKSTEKEEDKVFQGYIYSFILFHFFLFVMVNTGMLILVVDVLMFILNGLGLIKKIISLSGCHV
jgi:hypothetical protein